MSRVQSHEESRDRVLTALDRPGAPRCNGGMLELVAMTLTGYVVGSIACAVFVCRALGLPDPRKEGSGNPGATNVLRLGGKTAAALTLAGDVLKGVLPVLLARVVSDSPAVAAGAGLGAFAGHLYPVFFRFRGGKGVATCFGAVAALSWPIVIGMGAAWLVVAGLSRFASLASLTAALAAPVLAVVFDAPTAVLAALVAMCAMLVMRHQGNISRLLRGEERKIGARRD